MADHQETTAKQGQGTADTGSPAPEGVAKPPKLTASGFWLAFKYLGLPFLGILALLDLLLYALFYYGFGRCYGVMCLL